MCLHQYDTPVWWVGTKGSHWYPLSTCLPAWLLQTDHLAHLRQVVMPNAFAQGGNQGAYAPGGCDGVAHMSHFGSQGGAAHKGSTSPRWDQLGWVAQLCSMWHKVAHLRHHKQKEAHLRHYR